MPSWNEALEMTLGEWAIFGGVLFILGGPFWSAVTRLLSPPVPWEAEKAELIRHEAEAMARVERLEEDRYRILTEPSYYLQLRDPYGAKAEAKWSERPTLGPAPAPDPIYRFEGRA
jgi:hypothetical protein